MNTTIDPRLADVFAETDALLLDFDGPITPLMPAPVNWQIAESMRQVIRKVTSTLPEGIGSTADPLVVLRYVQQQFDESALAEVEAACVAGEMDAATTSRPTPGGLETIKACQAVKRPLAIVSNNSPESVQTYLDRFGVRVSGMGLLARPATHPELMKPNPYLVEAALAAMKIAPHRVAFIGDSVSDIDVSHAAGVRSIGYAKTSQRGIELDLAGAGALATSMLDVAGLISRASI